LETRERESYLCPTAGLRSTTSDKGWPVVSTGKNKTATAARSGTPANTDTANPCWQLLTKSTATNGHTIPPTRANEFAIPNPVDRVLVGYICHIQGTNRRYWVAGGFKTLILKMILITDTLYHNQET
jgi:hypothetical protein